MAGAYPDPPGRRIEYDRDGSGVISVTSGGVISTLSNANAQAMNDESDGVPSFTMANGAKFGVVFPAPMDIKGIFTSAGGGISGATWTIEHSTDTTTLNDGTWIQTVASSTAYTNTVVPIVYRNTIITASPMPLTGVKGVRVRQTAATGSPSPKAFHLYGNRTTTTGNWLMLWHPTLDQPLHSTPALTDLGDDARSSGFDTMSFRIKNCSTTLTANTVTVIREALTDGSPTVVSLMTINYNGGSYGTTATVGNLTPGQISQLVLARINVDVTAPPGVWAPRIVAAAASFS